MSKNVKELLKKPPLAIAHRGDPLVKPQNTKGAFLSAMEYDIDFIETDINMTKDGALVVVHDQKVDNVSNGKGWVVNFTLDELKKLDFGSWMGPGMGPETILTIAEFIELTKDGVDCLNIEIKSGPVKYDGICEKLVSTLESYDMIDRVIISSFDHLLLKNLKEMKPEILTAILYNAGLIDHITPAKSALADGVHPEHAQMTADTVKAIKDAGFFINVWTVDDEEDMKRMIDLEVSGIISNFPAKLCKVIKDGR
ncbi:MAG: glycerophosphodiester phosphodiesterase [Deltaproteobacteria bacterium]|uniref:Glycerophosphodiester phosphodiesterase n=1 Tax=Candidatus Zymogenus saltonus TaxID=2844893 RepID=A0A9D8PL54_9DELT|nr:glycerophosphodiester phosphodiesterase [Candidatus Zymogenus saltonus]